MFKSLLSPVQAGGLGASLRAEELLCARDLLRELRMFKKGRCRCVAVQWYETRCLLPVTFWFSCSVQQWFNICTAQLGVYIDIHFLTPA
jgi:hypothetical protein